MIDLDEAIESLGATAMRIADERNQLLAMLKRIVNAADRREIDPSEYPTARSAAIALLQDLANVR